MNKYEKIRISTLKKAIKNGQKAGEFLIDAGMGDCYFKEEAYFRRKVALEQLFIFLDGLRAQLKKEVAEAK